MTISAQDVKALRDRTGAGMMDCKKALQEANGDVDTAVDNLRKKGLAKAAKKAGRIAAEGIIEDKMSSDGNTAVLVEVNCETDFVVKTEDFRKYSANLAEVVLKEEPADLDSLLGLKIDGKLIKDFQTDLVAKIGENIHVRRFDVMKSAKAEKIGVYIHAGSKIGAMVLFDDPASKLEDQLAKEVAMHVAAMSPIYPNKDSVPESYISKEKEIIKEQISSDKKPPEILEKIMQGKLSKQLSEVCLEDQVFVKDTDGKTTVKNTLKKVDPSIKIKQFVRLQVGEGIEKKESNLAAEVAEMVK